jgi:hypothetical protein
VAVAQICLLGRGDEKTIWPCQYIACLREDIHMSVQIRLVETTWTYECCRNRIHGQP